MKKTPQLRKLSLQKTAIVPLNAKANVLIKGGGSWDGCDVQPSYPGTPGSCIGHTCESCPTEDPCCRTCADM